MSVANKVASAARSAVDNARKTADQALHDRGTLRKRIGTQVRDLPMTAVQLTVKGVGQALQVGDRVRQNLGRLTGRDGRTDDTAEPKERHETGAPAADTAPARQKSAFEEAARPEGVRPARRAKASQETGAPIPAPTAEGHPRSAPARPGELPIDGYDERTVPSLRAKLKGLSVEDLRQLLEYEKTHAARTEVIGMFERRIAKLQSE